MDLRGMQLRDAYQNLITIGSGGEVEDGEGVEIERLASGLLVTQNSILIPDDSTEVIYTSLPGAGIINISFSVGQPNGSAILFFNRAGTPDVDIGLQVGSVYEVTTGDMTGTTGTDGKVTVSIDSNDHLVVENRFGSSRTFSAYILGS